MEAQLAEDFAPFLHGADLNDVEDGQTIVIGLRSNLSIALLNEEWFRLAEGDGRPPDFSDRWGLEANYLEAIHGDAYGYYRDGLERVLQTGESWSTTYECPTPDEQRTFALRVEPLKAARGLLLFHRQRQARPFEEDEAEVDKGLDAYRDVYGILHQCAHCRRMRRQRDGHQWRWVPEAMRNPPRKISHGMCPTCFEHFGRHR